MLFRLILIIPIAHAALLTMPSLGDIPKMMKFAADLGDGAKKVSDLMNNTKECSIGQLFLHHAWRKAAKVNKTLIPLESQLHKKMQHMVKFLVTRNPLVQKVKSSFDDLHKMIRKIDELWKIFLNHTEKKSSFENHLKVYMRKTTGQHQGGLQNLLEEIHRLIVPIKRAHIRNSVFLTMLEKLNKTDCSCDETTSHQSTIHQIYSTLALTELRGYVMTVFSYKLRSMLDEKDSENIAVELAKAEAGFVLRTRNYLVAAQEAMKLASKQIRRCDPKKGYKRGVTFTEFEGLFQTFIVNEVQLAPENTCRYTCDTLGAQTFQSRKLREEHYAYRKPCRGRVVDCWSPGREVSICEMPSHNSRRYQWFKSAGKTYGDDGHSCLGTHTAVRSWRYWVFWRCDYCVCTCEAEQVDTTAFRTISLRESRTNVNQSMVMTGIRIVKHDGMIHMQVRQGMLLPEGRIVEANQSWVPLEEFRYIYEKADNHYDSYNLKKNGIWERLKLGTDYEFIRSGVNIMNLDDVTLPQGYVATGVRFTHVRDQKDNVTIPINIEVLATKFNYETGSVCGGESSSFWVDSRQHGARSPVKFNHPDIPTKYRANVPTTEPNLYVKFQASDLKKDAGQSTIPFWDTQEVITKPASPLQGVGLFFKGHDEGLFGGFLALRIYTLDITNHLNSTLIESMLHKYELSYLEPLYSPEVLTDLSNDYDSSFDETEEK